MTTPRNVLFVCLHGAAKSVLAAADFRRLAAERGLDIGADSAGTEPDPVIAPAVLRALQAEGLDLSEQRPRLVRPADLARAWRLVAFGCDLRALAPPGARIEQWDDVPAVSDDLPAARAAIRAHVERLVEEEARR